MKWDVDDLFFFAMVFLAGLISFCVTVMLCSVM